MKKCLLFAPLLFLFACSLNPDTPPMELSEMNGIDSVSGSQKGRSSLQKKSKEYQIEFLADTIGNYIPDMPTFAKTTKKGNEYVVTIQVEDSGIHVSYFFKYTSKWELYLIEDGSS